MPSPIINLDIQHDLNVTQDTNPLSQGTKEGGKARKGKIKKLPCKSPEEIQKQMQGALEWDDRADKCRQSHTHHYCQSDPEHSRASGDDSPGTMNNTASTGGHERALAIKSG